MRSRVQSLRLKVEGFGFIVEGVGVLIRGSVFRVWIQGGDLGVRFGIQILWLKIAEFGFELFKI